MWKFLTVASVAVLTLTGCASASPTADDLDDNYSVSVVNDYESLSYKTAVDASSKLPFVYVHTRNIADAIFYAPENCQPTIENIIYDKANIDPVSGNYEVKVYIKDYRSGECSGPIVPHIQNITFVENKIVDFQNTNFKYCVQESDVCWDFSSVFYRAGTKLDKE